ncbi:16S rRNA (guanine(966)-N(2))-methyltransferase RsmD [Thioalkalivibrio sp. HK1]|uniref:16S rRNA (guanine(966)-N(2))-methyltransferase RsmD n=1 Tax=Thioalkalivibrio sp. HK1 TaxID=1469245 RepID=UPI0006879F85|nr:16S rRNA (guanine(966)-N(2))-methyltransferase RsmD [Thioalkalivibrio sp. HK1]
MPSGNIRIIAGRWRRRLLPVADSIGLRPTPSRVRETLFNWLQDEIEGRTCLDLFAGTGALGFEAASRGAKEVVMVERKRDLARSLEKTASDLGAGSIEVHCADALTWRPAPDKRFDLVFLDPPWSGPSPAEALKYLGDIEAIAPCALVGIESDRKTEDRSLPAGWTLRRRLCAGQVRYGLFERDPPFAP